MKQFAFLFIVFNVLFAKSQTKISNSYFNLSDSLKNYSTTQSTIELKNFNSVYKADSSLAFFSELLLGDTCMYKNLFAYAQTHYLKALNLVNTSNNDNCFLVNYKIGYCNLSNNNLSQAVTYYNKAILARPYHSTNFKINYALYIQAGVSYSYLSQIETSNTFYFKGLQLAIKQNDKNRISNVLNNISLNYIKSNDTINAIKYLNKCLAIRNEIGDSLDIAQSYNNFGQFYLQINKYNTAINYFNTSIKIKQNNDSKPVGIIESKINTAKCYVKLGNYTKAQILLESQLILSKEIQHIELQRRIYEQLILVYGNTNQYQKAFETQAQFYAINDSMYGLDKKEELNKLSLQHNFNLKQQHDSLKYTRKELENKKALEVNAVKEKRLQIILGIIVISLSVFVYFVIKLNRSNKRIQQANHIITNQKNELAQQQKEVLASIRYAKRIQQAMLPSEKFIDKVLKKKGK